MFADALRALRLLAGTLRTVTVDRENLRSRAGKDFLTVTELADTLVRREGMSFREAHHIVAETVKACGTNDDVRNIAATMMSLYPSLHLTPEEVDQALDPENFVRIRSIPGGPAPEAIRDAIARSQVRQREFEAWMEKKTSLLDRAHAELHQTARS